MAISGELSFPDVPARIKEHNESSTAHSDRVDDTLSQDGMFADAGAAGDALDGKVSKPATTGTTGQFLRLGENGPEWDDIPTDTALTQSGVAADGKKVGDELTDLKSALADITGNQKIEVTGTGAYIKLSDSTANINSPVASVGSEYAVVPCSEGDVFTISTTGGDNGRAYGFVSSNGDVLRVANASTTVTRYIVTAPRGSAYLVINAFNTHFTAYHGFIIGDRVEKINSNFNSFSNDVGNTIDNSLLLFSKNHYLKVTDGTWTVNSNFPNIFGSYYSINISDYGSVFVSMNTDDYSFRILQYEGPSASDFIEASNYYTGSELICLNEVISPSCVRVKFNIRDDINLDNSGFDACVGAFRLIDIDLEKYFISKNDFDNLNNFLFEKRNIIPWSDFATEEYTTGWRKGYWGKQTMTVTDSSKYICTASPYIASTNDNILLIPPDERYIYCRVFNDNGVFVAEYEVRGVLDGVEQRLPGESVLIPMTEGYQYVFNIGRWDSGSSISTGTLATCYIFKQRTLVDYTRNKKETNILAIGNSWCRDAVRYLSACLKDAGYATNIVQAYMGGSSLHAQYFGIDDVDYEYTHGSFQQKVHSTYQSWTYLNTINPTYNPPSSQYNNGASGAGRTLESIVGDAQWDYIIFMGTRSRAGSHGQFVDSTMTNTFTIDGETITQTWDINSFIDKVLSWCENMPKIYFASAWAISKNTSGSNWNSAIIDYADLWTESGNDRSSFYELMNDAITESLMFGLAHMGDRIDGFIDLSKVMYYARKNDYLSAIGYDMQRAQDNTHLANGLPKFVCSFAIANKIFGINDNDVTFFPTDTTDDDSGTDSGNSEAIGTSWAG